jgi:peroxiredoxin family protein
LGSGRLLLLCERGGFAPLHQAVSAAGAAIAAGRRCDLVLFHSALSRVTCGAMDDLEELTGEGLGSYREALDSGRVRPVSAQLAEAREAGLRIYACSASVALLGLDPGELLGLVDDVVGWPTVLAWMDAADRVLYL